MSKYTPVRFVATLAIDGGGGMWLWGSSSPDILNSTHSYVLQVIARELHEYVSFCEMLRTV